VNPARPTDVPPRPRRRISRAERRVTFWLKTLGLIAVAIYLLVGLLQFLGAVRTTGMLFVGAVFFAYLVYPLVRRFNERLPLLWSVVLVYAVIGVVAAAVVQILVPPLISDAQNLARATPGLVTHYSEILRDPNNRFIRFLPLDERLYLASLPAQLSTFLQHNAQEFATRTLAVVLSTVSVVATVVIIPILSAYMLLDMEHLKESFLGLLPVKNRPKGEVILDDLDKVVGGFIRGQLIDGAIVGAMITVMLFALHVPYALLIGVAAGILNFIPYAGAVIGFVPSVILALSYNGPTNALIVAALFAVIQQVDGNFVAPRVLKDNVGLSPFWIILSILTFTELFGLPGTFLAVPAAAMIRVLREQLLPPPAPRAVAQPELTPEPLAKSRPGRARG
jgi:predicted PurR-regulated permease PerM